MTGDGGAFSPPTRCSSRTHRRQPGMALPHDHVFADQEKKGVRLWLIAMEKGL